MKAPRTIAAALLAALTLAACAPASGTQASAPAAAPDTGQAADPAAAAGADLRILTAGNADGMYAAVTVPEPGSRIFPTLLSWIDYASARQVILCSRPNCDHSDDSCPARLPAGAGEAGCYALDDGLLLKYSVTDPDTYALTGQYLCLCAADGSDPRLLAQTAANWDLLTDGDAVYYSCQQAESQDLDALAQSVWYRQPLSGGQAEELFRCDIADMPVCCAGRELVQVSWFDNALYAVNMDTGVRRTLPMTPAGEDGQSSAFAALDGRLYQLLPGDTDTLRWLDIASGQAGTLALQWPDGAAAGRRGRASVRDHVDRRPVGRDFQIEVQVVQLNQVVVAGGSLYPLRIVRPMARKPLLRRLEHGLRHQAQGQLGTARKPLPVERKVGLDAAQALHQVDLIVAAVFAVELHNARLGVALGQERAYRLRNRRRDKAAVRPAVVAAVAPLAHERAVLVEEEACLAVVVALHLDAVSGGIPVAVHIVYVFHHPGRLRIGRGLEAGAHGLRQIGQAAAAVDLAHNPGRAAPVEPDFMLAAVFAELGHEVSALALPLHLRNRAVFALQRGAHGGRDGEGLRVIVVVAAGGENQCACGAEHSNGKEFPTFHNRLVFKLSVFSV